MRAGTWENVEINICKYRKSWEISIAHKEGRGTWEKVEMILQTRKTNMGDLKGT